LASWTVYTHRRSHPLSPTHAPDRTRLPLTFCLIPWPIINHRFPTLDRTSTSLPTPLFVCLSIRLPDIPILPFCLQISVMREMPISSLRLFVSTSSH